MTNCRGGVGSSLPGMAKLLNGAEELEQKYLDGSTMKTEREGGDCGWVLSPQMEFYTVYLPPRLTFLCCQPSLTILSYHAHLLFLISTKASMAIKELVFSPLQLQRVRYWNPFVSSVGKAFDHLNSRPGV